MAKKYKTFASYRRSLTDYHAIQMEEKDQKTSTTIFFTGIEKLSQRKVFIKRFTKEKDYYDEFDSESYALENINQQNIIKPIAIYEDKKYGYIIFPYAEGGDLFDLTCNEKVIFDNNQLKIITFVLLSAFERIHSNGFIYRDLKLENIVFLRKFEEMMFDFSPDDILLIDFGSIFISNKSKSLENFRGTSFYSPPEYIFHKRVTEKYDIFSLGVLLYYLATSYLPFNPNYQYDEIEMKEMLGENNIDKLFDDAEWNGFEPNLKNAIKSMLLFDENSRPGAKELLKNDVFDDLLSPYAFVDDKDDNYSIC